VKKPLIFLIIFLSSILTFSQITFEKTIGGISTEQAYSVAQTDDAGYIITGVKYNYTQGDADIYLIKTDANGNLLWDKTYGGTEDDEGYSVAQTSDGGYIIAGYTNSFGEGGYDVYLVKTDANGNLLWDKTYGKFGTEQGFSVAQTSDEGYIIAGYTESFGAYYYEVYLIKTNSVGDTLWTKALGETSKDVFGYSVAQNVDGGYIITGYNENIGPGKPDVYLVKTDVSGNALWSKTFGGVSEDYGYSVAQTSDEGYIIAGYTYSFGAGSCDVFLIKTDINGDTSWTKTFGGTKCDWSNSIVQTFDGGYIFAGSTDSYGAGLTDVYIVKMDANGNDLFTKTYGSSSLSEIGYSIAQTSDSGYIITGIVQSNGETVDEIYLVKTDAFGNILNSKQNSNGISVYPNPTTGIINIQIAQQFGTVKMLEIYNSIGKIQLLKSDNFSDIDVSFLRKGLYFIVVTNFENAKLIQKIVKT
jgi:hypothetical protein